MGNPKKEKIIMQDTNGKLIAKIPIGTQNPLGPQDNQDEREKLTETPVNTQNPLSLPYKQQIPDLRFISNIKKPEQPKLMQTNKFGLVPSSKLYKIEFISTKIIIQKFIHKEPEMTINQKNWFMKLMSLQTSGIDNQIPKRTKKVYDDLKFINNSVGKEICSNCKEQLCCTINYNEKKENQEYCYFFKDGKCSIYKFRPIMCRNFLCDIITKEWLVKFCKRHNITLGIYDEKEINALKDNMATLT